MTKTGESCYHIYDKNNNVLAHNLSKDELVNLEREYLCFLNNGYEIQEVRGHDYGDASY